MTANLTSTSQTKLRWGLLATGNIAKSFANGVLHSKHGVLAACASRDLKKAKAFGAQFGIARCHGSYEALLADPGVDAVYISTPHPLHAQWVVKAAEAGKHILCEKPLGLNMGEAMTMIEAARDNGVFLMEAFMFRCHPQIAKVVALIKEGAIGKVKVIQSTFSFQMGYNETHRLMANDLAGGGILDVGCYPVSLSRLIAGAALGRDFANPLKVSGSAVLNPNTGTDEFAIASLEFEGGILAQLSTGVLVNQKNDTRIYGDAGSILLTSPWIPAPRGGTVDIVLERKGQPVEVIPVTTSAANEWLYGLEADTVALNIQNGQAPSPAMSWADTLGNIQTLDRWRAAVGLTYNSEKLDSPAQAATVSRRPLVHARRARSRMRYGEIAGVSKLLSRVIMGVDNQPGIAYASAIFDDFYERGGNMFDVGYIYMGGMAEQLLGTWIKNRGLRDQVAILGKGAHTPFCNPVDLSKQLMISLERLKTDHIDVYCMHRDNPEVPVAEFVDVLNEHVRAGRFKVFGGSNWTVERIEEGNAYAVATGQQGFSVLSNNFSLARMVAPPWTGCLSASTPELRSWLTRTQMPLLPWSSQARGFFLPFATPEYTGDPEIVRCWYAEDNFERKRRATEMAKQRGVAPINIALAYVLNQPFPTFPLIGPRTIEETRSSLEGIDIDLSPDEVRWLNLES